MAQVPNGGQHQSCCAVLEGCMRCIFFVPQPGTFTGAELTRLEAEAAANPGAKGPLLRHLHVREHSEMVLTLPCPCSSRRVIRAS